MQRRIMDALIDTGDKWIPVRELAGATPGQRESARRAVHALAAAGKVETRIVYRPRYGRAWRGWMGSSDSENRASSGRVKRWSAIPPEPYTPKSAVSAMCSWGPADGVDGGPVAAPSGHGGRLCCCVMGW